MAKKIAFLMVLMSVLILASVTAFATGTDSTAPKTGFTEEKANHEISVSELEEKNPVFFDEKATSDMNFVTIKFQREYSAVSDLRYNFTASVIDTSTSSAINENPVVMLMYIKVDGKYTALNDITTGTNMSEGSYLLPSSKVDLMYLGSGKVNDVRIIAFRKKDMDNLVVNETLQIFDLPITAPHWKLYERRNYSTNSVNLPAAP